MTSLEIVRTIEAELSRRGISKGQFYKDCDISSATFSQWRTGTYYPSLTALNRIAEYLRLGLAFSPDGLPSLIPQFEEQKKEVPAVEPATDEQLKFALFNGTENVTDSMLDEVKRFARMVALMEEEKKKNGRNGRTD